MYNFEIEKNPASGDIDSIFKTPCFNSFFYNNSEYSKGVIQIDRKGDNID